MNINSIFPAYQIAFIGDSVSMDVAPIVGEIMEVKVLNGSISGSSSADWLPSKGNLEWMLIRSIGTKTIHINLGINDAKDTVARSPEDFFRNLRIICEILKLTGHTVVISYPSYIVPGSYSNFSTATNLRLLLYQQEINRLVDGKQVILGDVKSYRYFQEHRENLKDGVHPTKLGSIVLALMWANAIDIRH